MALTNAGRDHIAQTIVGEAVTAFNNANAHVGVGNSSTAFDAAQTDLQGASKFYEPMDATFPTRATNVLTFESTFETADANFAWEEVGIFNAVTPGTMLSRKVQSLGTKTSADTWVLTVDVTVTAA